MEQTIQSTIPYIISSGFVTAILAVTVFCQFRALKKALDRAMDLTGDSMALLERYAMANLAVDASAEIAPNVGPAIIQQVKNLEPLHTVEEPKPPKQPTGVTVRAGAQA